MCLDRCPSHMASLMATMLEFQWNAIEGVCNIGKCMCRMISWQAGDEFQLQGMERKVTALACRAISWNAG